MVRALLLLAGAAAVLLGLGLLATGALTLPTRHPPVALHFSGPALLLLAATPMLVGTLLLALGSGRLQRQAPVARLLAGVAIAAVALALLLAPRY
ncbi:MAG: hypothetical protein HZB72_04885 [Burkholderiales bacterium]|nr:hypothetical protein [Burkholderiales bacterium]